MLRSRSPVVLSVLLTAVAVAAATVAAAQARPRECADGGPLAVAVAAAPSGRVVYGATVQGDLRPLAADGRQTEPATTEAYEAPGDSAAAGGVIAVAAEFEIRRCVHDEAAEVLGVGAGSARVLELALVRATATGGAADAANLAAADVAPLPFTSACDGTVHVVAASGAAAADRRGHELLEVLLRSLNHTLRAPHRAPAAGAGGSEVSVYTVRGEDEHGSFELLHEVAPRPADGDSDGGDGKWRQLVVTGERVLAGGARHTSHSVVDVLGDGFALHARTPATTTAPLVSRVRHTSLLELPGAGASAAATFSASIDLLSAKEAEQGAAELNSSTWWAAGRSFPSPGGPDWAGPKAAPLRAAIRQFSAEDLLEAATAAGSASERRMVRAARYLLSVAPANARADLMRAVISKCVDAACPALSVSAAAGAVAAAGSAMRYETETLLLNATAASDVCGARAMIVLTSLALSGVGDHRTLAVLRHQVSECCGGGAANASTVTSCESMMLAEVMERRGLVHSKHRSQRSQGRCGTGLKSVWERGFGPSLARGTVSLLAGTEGRGSVAEACLKVNLFGVIDKDVVAVRAASDGSSAVRMMGHQVAARGGPYEQRKAGDDGLECDPSAPMSEIYSREALPSSFGAVSIPFGFLALSAEITAGVSLSASVGAREQMVAQTRTGEDVSALVGALGADARVHVGGTLSASFFIASASLDLTVTLIDVNGTAAAGVTAGGLCDRAEVRTSEMGGEATLSGTIGFSVFSYTVSRSLFEWPATPVSSFPVASTPCCRPCQGECATGECDTSRGVCVCASDYGGTFCNVPAASGRTTCPRGMYGLDCKLSCPPHTVEDPVDGCCAGGRCECQSGFAGPRCAACPGQSCGAGTCIWDGSTATCECPLGAMGPSCAVTCPVGGEHGAVCANHGVCYLHSNGTDASCLCDFGWSGPACAQTAAATATPASSLALCASPATAAENGPLAVLANYPDNDWLQSGSTWTGHFLYLPSGKKSALLALVSDVANDDAGIFLGLAPNGTMIVCADTCAVLDGDPLAPNTWYSFALGISRVHANQRIVISANVSQTPTGALLGQAHLLQQPATFAAPQAVAVGFNLLGCVDNLALWFFDTPPPYAPKVVPSRQDPLLAYLWRFDERFGSILHEDVAAQSRFAFQAAPFVSRRYGPDGLRGTLASSPRTPDPASVIKALNRSVPVATFEQTMPAASGATDLRLGVVVYATGSDTCALRVSFTQGSISSCLDLVSDQMTFYSVLLGISPPVGPVDFRVESVGDQSCEVLVAFAALLADAPSATALLDSGFAPLWTQCPSAPRSTSVICGTDIENDFATGTTVARSRGICGQEDYSYGYFPVLSCTCAEGYYGQACGAGCGPGACSGVGMCTTTDGAAVPVCQCPAGRAGADCSLACPNLCSGVGECVFDPASGGLACSCPAGSGGADCSRGEEGSPGPNIESDLDSTVAVAIAIAVLIAIPVGIVLCCSVLLALIVFRVRSARRRRRRHAGANGDEDDSEDDQAAEALVPLATDDALGDA